LINFAASYFDFLCFAFLFPFNYWLFSLLILPYTRPSSSSCLHWGPNNFILLYTNVYSSFHCSQPVPSHFSFSYNYSRRVFGLLWARCDSISLFSLVTPWPWRSTTASFGSGSVLSRSTEGWFFFLVMFVSLSLISILLLFMLCETSDLSFLMLICIFYVYFLINCQYCSCFPSLLCFLLLLQFIVACVFFATTSLIFLFISYEFSLLPMSIVILLFGYQPEKLSATLWFLLYLVISGLPLFLWVTKEEGSLVNGFTCLPPQCCFLVSLSFLFKTPLYTLHLWLPKAHVEAPLIGSIFLSGILLKMGGYGILILRTFIHSLFSIFVYFSLSGSLICAISCFRCWDLKG